MKKTDVVSIRITTDDHRRLKERAAEAGVSVSDLLRSRALTDPAPRFVEEPSRTVGSRAVITWLTPGVHHDGTFTLGAAA